jgi:hypothetical protein
MKHVVLLFAAAFLSLIVAVSPTSGQLNSPVAYPLQNKVTIDGKYTNPTEWNDTIPLKLVGGLGQEGYFMAKYDSNYLYTMWDFPECKTSFTGSETKDANEVIFYINALNKYTTIVDDTMYRIDAWDDSPPHARVSGSQGLAAGGWASWAHLDGTGYFTTNIQYTSSPYSQTPHMILELRIALTFAGLKSATTSNSIGVGIEFGDNSNDFFLDYPSNWNYKDPSTWGTLTFSHTTVPEFPLGSTVPILTSILLTILASRMAIKKPSDKSPH